MAPVPLLAHEVQHLCGQGIVEKSAQSLACGFMVNPCYASRSALTQCFVFSKVRTIEP